MLVVWAMAGAMNAKAIVSNQTSDLVTEYIDITLLRNTRTFVRNAERSGCRTREFSNTATTVIALLINMGVE